MKPAEFFTDKAAMFADAATRLTLSTVAPTLAPAINTYLDQAVEAAMGAISAVHQEGKHTGHAANVARLEVDQRSI